MICTKCKKTDHYEYAEYCADCGTRLYYLMCGECGKRITDSNNDCECLNATGDQDKTVKSSTKGKKYIIPDEEEFYPVDCVLDVKYGIKKTLSRIYDFLVEEDAKEIVWILEEAIVTLNNLHYWVENHECIVAS